MHYLYIYMIMPTCEDGVKMNKKLVTESIHEMNKWDLDMVRLTVTRSVHTVHSENIIKILNMLCQTKNI